jgi:hypothetical protein
MQLEYKIKAYIFVAMIVKSALFFLGLVDFILDSYERVSPSTSKANKKEVMPTTKLEKTNPAYLIQ